MADNKSRESECYCGVIGKDACPEHSAQSLSIKLSVDITEALTGLKAITREARKAKQALAELSESSTQSHITININSDTNPEEVIRKLSEELSRKGISI